MKIKLKILITLVFPFLLGVSSCISVEEDVADEMEDIYAVSTSPSPSEEKTEVFKPGRSEVRSLEKAYPFLITDVAETESDSSFLLNGRRFYFSSGRLLPEEKKDDVSGYRSYGFYNYPEKLPPIVTPDKESLEMMDRFIEQRGSLSRDNSFLDQLYGGGTLNEILKEIVYIDFLGFRFEVHRRIAPVLRAVEKEILEESEKDINLKVFISTISTAGGFNWRQINGGKTRSYHSYGIAVDFIPQDLDRKQTFWNWSMKFNSEWYNIPYSDRWMIPEKFVSVFEKYGFIWGGKWLYFDNMHFEYRPEILILSGRDVADVF